MSARKPHITFICIDPAMYSLLPVMQELRHQGISMTIAAYTEGPYAITSENIWYELTDIPVIPFSSDLDLSAHRTDILVFHKPSLPMELLTGPKTSDNEKPLTVYFPYAAEFLGENYTGWVVNLPHTKLADILFASSPLGMAHYGLYNPLALLKLHDLGNPEMDILVERSYERHAAYPAMAHFCQGHPTFLWTPHWMIDEYPFWSSWLQFGAALALFFARHPQCRLIIRPHPHLFPVFTRSETDGHRKALKILDKLQALPNVMLDETATALMSIGLADFLISDCSSIIQKFFATGKPMIVNEANYGLMRPMLDSTTYLTDTPYQLMQYMDDLLAGIDPKQEQRLEYRDSVCGPTDGQCTRRITDFLLQEWEQRHP